MISLAGFKLEVHSCERLAASTAHPPDIGFQNHHEIHSQGIQRGVFAHTKTLVSGVATSSQFSTNTLPPLEFSLSRAI